MGDESTLLLQTILNEQREARREISDIMRRMVDKTDLANTEEGINTKITSFETKFEAHATTLATVKAAEEKNTHFRNSIYKGAAYVVGSVFVAILGAITAFLFPHNGSVASAAVMQTPVPAATSTPFRQ